MAGAAELVGFSSNAAFAIGADQRILVWNDPAEKLLGYTAREAVGSTCYEILRSNLPDGEAVCGPDCAGARDLGLCRPYSVRTCFVRGKDGSRVPVGISSIALPPADGEARNGAPVALIMLHEIDGRPALHEAAGAPMELSDSLRLAIHTFGRFRLFHGGSRIPVEKWHRKHAVTLLKYLAHNVGRPVHREKLIECLWQDLDGAQGRERLKVTVYFLREELSEGGAPRDAVQTIGHTYMLRPEAVWVDSLALEDLASEGRALEGEDRTAEAIQRFEKVRQLYQGDYLEEDLYTDWCAEERGRLCEIYLDVLASLAELYAVRRDYASAAAICYIALVRENCRESLHRAMMNYLVALDRPDRAIKQYHRCVRILRDELGVAPAKETQRLYESIAGNVAPLPVSRLAGAGASRHAARIL